MATDLLLGGHRRGEDEVRGPVHGVGGPSLAWDRGLTHVTHVDIVTEYDV